MILTKYRPILILLLLAMGIYLQFTFDLATAMYLYGAAILMIFTQLAFDNVMTAHSYLKRGKLELSAQLISKIWTPQFLWKSHKAYYHFTKGMLELQKKSFSPALVDLEKANKIGMKTPMDNALNSLNIAHIYFVQKDKKQARVYLDKTKAFTTNDLLLDEKIAEMERALKRMK